MRVLAWIEGHRDGRQGNASCPYPVGTREHPEWVRGYIDACEERRRLAQASAHFELRARGSRRPKGETLLEIARSYRVHQL